MASAMYDSNYSNLESMDFFSLVIVTSKGYEV